MTAFRRFCAAGLLFYYMLLSVFGGVLPCLCVVDLNLFSMFHHVRTRIVIASFCCENFVVSFDYFDVLGIAYCLHVLSDIGGFYRDCCLLHAL